MLHLCMGLVLRKLQYPEAPYYKVEESIFFACSSSVRDGRVGAAPIKLGNKITAEAKLLLKCLGCTAEGQESFN